MRLWLPLHLTARTRLVLFFYTAKCPSLIKIVQVIAERLWALSDKLLGITF
ncbi:hypothetical protein FIBSPDRAFT_533363 [Athelia psychrophila]|uniref:Uncharacterized protein n=1 Tax=Athelia psychrophila TaxID=1759441 RepID=A0A166JAK7_9AGAM|nr:hypothetical protein FIBSPDRAFT_533363 [Fibularhizoctonia sp. CBS 109695]